MKIQKDKNRCVFKFLEGEECVYIGTSSNLEDNLYQYKAFNTFNNVTRIERTDYINYERAELYKSKFLYNSKPKYNKNYTLKCLDSLDIEMENLIFYKYVKEKKETYADKLIILLNGIVANKKNYKHLLQVKKIRGKEVIQKKMYKKSLIIEELGIKKTQFKNIIGSIEVVEWLEKHKVVNSGQVLDFSKYKK